MTNPGWGVSIEGDPLDLEDWAENLKPQFEPWVEKHDEETVLRSAAFDELDSSDDVYQIGLAYIDRLNGIFALVHQTGPVRFRSILQFTADGKKHLTLSPATASAAGRARVRGISGAIDADGKPLPAVASEVQRTVAIVQDDELLDDAVTYFSRGASWFDIYKALECLELWASKASKSLSEWESNSEIKLLKQTANWARHAKKKFDPPKKPMRMKDARELLARLLRRAMIEKG